ncbi:hypothetical protein C0991_005347 [Blastosporella zonata]|nr:hypothetical protein C0991_005347 [Blastosporella zonata]
MGHWSLSPLDSTAAFPSVSKSVMVTTVLNEAGLAIYGSFPDPLPSSAFDPACQATFGANRTAVVVDSPYYPPAPSIDGSDPDARIQLQSVGTDYLWKCSGWTLARNWVQNGGQVYVGEYQLGASYPGNSAVSYCTEPGVVCHQDDIEIVFGTVPSPTAAQSALVTEMQQRYKAFMTTGNPNVAGLATWTAATSSNVNAFPLGSTGPVVVGAGLATWTAATSSNVNAFPLGSTGPVVVGACDPSFWGQAVQYDYQVYGI